MIGIGIGIVWWTGVAAGGAGVVAAYSEDWLVAGGFGLLAFICAVIVGRPGEVRPNNAEERP